MITAQSVLEAGLGHMKDRAATYDKEEGERSMGATVAAFQAVTAHRLTEEQGWLFMVLLKAVRTQQGGFRADNYEDGAAYYGLMGEAAYNERADVAPAKPRAAAPAAKPRKVRATRKTQRAAPTTEQVVAHILGKTAPDYSAVWALAPDWAGVLLKNRYSESLALVESFATGSRALLLPAGDEFILKEGAWAFAESRPGHFVGKMA